MPALANVFFRNIFATLLGGIFPQALATGTNSGTALALGGTGPLGKLLFRALGAMTASATSNSGVLSMWLATASSSAGVYTSLSQTLVSTTVSISTSLYQLVIDTRLEAFSNLGTTANVAPPLWVKPVVSITNATLGFALDILGWEAGNDPASSYDGANVATTELDFY